MITHFRVQNYKALRDVTLRLTPVHVLIGPNDSGKTSLQEAIAAVSRSVDMALDDAFVGTWSGNDLVWQGKDDARVSFEVEMDVASTGRAMQYELECEFCSDIPRARAALEAAVVDGFRHERRGGGGWTAAFTHRRSQDPSDQRPEAETFRLMADAVSGVAICRFNPRVLGLPVAAESTPRASMSITGFGLAGVLDTLHWTEFQALERHFTAMFPDIAQVVLQAEEGYKADESFPDGHNPKVTAPGKGLRFKLASTGHVLPASQVSDGVLLGLGYAALVYGKNSPRILLIDEPESGIHPSLLAEIVRALRGLVEAGRCTQILMTTHSPYMVDLFEPNEVTLCRKQEDGSVAVTLLADNPTVVREMDMFNLGEIWSILGEEKIAAVREQPDTYSPETTPDD